MLRIAFVVPYPELEPIIHETWQKHTEVYKNTKLEEGYEFSYIVDTGVSPANIASRQYDTDVIVSRGGTALGLKEMNYYIPIIEIPLTSHDIRATIDNAIQHYGTLPIGIVGTNNMVSAVSMMDTGDLDIKVYHVLSVEENALIHGVNDAVKDGRKIVIGGINTVNYCANNGIKSEMLVSSREAIWQAITEAKRAAILTNQERRRTALFEAILNQMFEGMISVGNDEHIQLINSAATQMLGLREGVAVGQPMDKALPAGRLIYLLKSRKTFLNEVIRYNSNQFVVNCVPLQLGGAQIGTVVTFQSANTISEAESEVRAITHARGHIARHRFEDILGESKVIEVAKNRAKQYAAVDSNIMLVGETGTGKELFAQSIHNASTRSKAPFVAVNCAALPENLMESEFFGYVEGAFTGAVKGGKPGLFELAHLGTIFLDEISEIPSTLQSRLLRVIQEREIMRLGHDRVIPIDVRIICATNKDLQKMVADGTFREDLYYRLNVLSISLPPLRERERDAVLIMHTFLDSFCNRFDKPPLHVSPEVEDIVGKYTWSGNVRHLRNICEQLVVMNTTGYLTITDLSAILPQIIPQTPAPITAPTTSVLELPLEVNLAELEKARIIEALNKCKNKADVAKILGIGRTTLWRKLKEYGLA